jgi:hypothetical protein
MPRVYNVNRWHNSNIAPAAPTIGYAQAMRRIANKVASIIQCHFRFTAEPVYGLLLLALLSTADGYFQAQRLRDPLHGCVV